MNTSHQYEHLCKLAKDCVLPAMFVDLNAFDRNANRFIELARQSNKAIRIASKSVRVPALLERFQQLAGDLAQGLMCYSVMEAHFLAEHGFNDLLVAYPHTQPHDIRIARELTEEGTSITLMIDCLEHVDQLVAQLGDPTANLRVCIDIDASLRKFGQHLGAQRSPLRNIQQLRTLLEKVKRTPQLSVVGAMTYEAQVAGLADSVPGQGIKNRIVRSIKSASMRWLEQYRNEIRQTFETAEIQLTFFNGGGSGSFAATAADDSLTEVTVGSGLLQSHLFDGFVANRSEPAIFFALPISRKPQSDVVTCHSGGFIASGSPGPDRQPTLFSPSDLRVEPREGFGEVQTPLVVPDAWQEKLGIGNPIFFRPAKAGEIAERFDEYILFRNDRIEDRAKTYRGLGRCFF